MAHEDFIYQNQKYQFSYTKIKHEKPNIDFYDVVILTDTITDPFGDSLEFYALKQEDKCLVYDDGYASYNLICFDKPKIKHKITTPMALAIADEAEKQKKTQKYTDSIYVVGDWKNLAALVRQMVEQTQQVYQPLMKD